MDRVRRVERTTAVRKFDRQAEALRDAGSNPATKPKFSLGNPYLSFVKLGNDCRTIVFVRSLRCKKLIKQLICDLRTETVSIELSYDFPLALDSRLSQQYVALSFLEVLDLHAPVVITHNAWL